MEAEMKKIFKFNKGQIIPIVALMLLAIIAMVMLILDGGALLSYRRTAQAAADAGALAGAQNLCWHLSEDSKGVAEAYAINNGASTAEANIDVDGYQVTVTATVLSDSFFARVFGVDELKASAEAIAGCQGVRGKGVIPLAWNCVPNDDPNPAFNPNIGCQEQPLSWDLIGDFVNGINDSVAIKDSDGNSVTYDRYSDGTSLVDDPNKDTPIPPEQIYILFDDQKLCIEEYYDSCYYKSGVYCCEQGGVETCGLENLDGDWQCDLDGDGKKDLQLGGERGLIYLTSSDNSIIKWITADTQPDITLRPHVWLTAESGIGAVVGKMDSYNWGGEIVLVPIYNYQCEDNPSSNAYCITEAHSPLYTGDNWAPFLGEDTFDIKSGGSLWFHIIAFQPFYLSCVSSKGDCPGYRYAQTINTELKDNVDVVEGYFLSDYDDVSIDGNVFCDALQLNNCGITLKENNGD